MPASYSTIAEVVRVIRKHVDARTFQAIMEDLRCVKGNSSFDVTIKRLADAAKAERIKEEGQ